MPYISTETLLGAALLAVLAVGYQYLPTNSDPNSGPSGMSSGASKSAKKRAKKKNKGENESGANTSGTSTPAQAQQGQVEQKSKGSVPPTSSGTADPAGKAKKEAQPQQKKKLLAERLLPKEPKTKVDDMLAPEDRPPSIARVMKVSSSSYTTPTFASISGGRSSASATAAAGSASGSGYGAITPSQSSDQPEAGSSTSESGGEGEKVAKFQDDYANVSGPESGDGGFTPVQSKKKSNDGWDVVTSKKKKPTSSTASDFSSAYDPRQSTSLPLPIATRNQKKNLKKADGKKLARAAEEEDRLRRLAMHKKDLERERINELYAAKQSNPARGKALGGGLGSNATVTSNGKLVWD